LSTWWANRSPLQIYCDSIVSNKSIGIYDGAYKRAELATGRRFERKPALPTAV